MRSAAPLTLALATVASALARTRWSHGASGRASTRRLAGLCNAARWSCWVSKGGTG